MPASRDGLSESYMIGDEAMMHHQQQMQQRSFPGANYAHEPPPPPQQQVSVCEASARARHLPCRSHLHVQPDSDTLILGGVPHTIFVCA
jgi:hypothetical protein